MLQEVKEITPTTKKLIISIPPEVIEQEFVRAYDKLRVSVKNPRIQGRQSASDNP